MSVEPAKISRTPLRPLATRHRGRGIAEIAGERPVAVIDDAERGDGHLMTGACDGPPPAEPSPTVTSWR